MAAFKFALQACGLSQSEAAELLGVRLDTVKSWSAGRNAPPEGVWVMLADLFEQIQDAADGAAGQMAVDGIDPRSWGNIQADIAGDPLPSGSDSIAGAMALLMAIKDQIDEQTKRPG